MLVQVELKSCTIKPLPQEATPSKPVFDGGDLSLKSRDGGQGDITIAIADGNATIECGGRDTIPLGPVSAVSSKSEGFVSFTCPGNTVIAEFAASTGAKLFLTAAATSEFDASRDESSVGEYFKYYAHLSQQQNMMQDTVRTTTYRDAILRNYTDFQDKVILDVGAGSGLLSFFAAQAGAKKVYAVEASNMAKYARKLVDENGLSDVIEVLNGKIEEVELPEKVDTIISEPLGVMLVNERMMESYVHARKWLKPDGKMFPTNSTLFVCPFTDNALYQEVFAKTSFWQTPSFYGIDLSSLHLESHKEMFGQPCVEQVNPQCLIGEPTSAFFDYLTMPESDFYEIVIPFSYKFEFPQEITGIASWFDNDFVGSQETITLSTSPYAPVTHWYQVRCLFEKPLMLKPNEEFTGELCMKINRIQSYDITINVTSETGSTARAAINLKEPNFRFGYGFATDSTLPSQPLQQQQQQQQQQQYPQQQQQHDEQSSESS